MMKKFSYLLISFLLIINIGELNAQAPMNLKVYKASCAPGNEWTGWVSQSYPWFYYEYPGPYERAEIFVSDAPFGGSYNVTKEFVNTNVCNQWTDPLPTGKYVWRVRVWYQSMPSGVWVWSPETWGNEFWVDVTPPNPPVVTDNDCGGSHTGWPAWINHTSPYFTWDNPGDAGGGVSYYQVEVWNIFNPLYGSGWFNVSSLWHPTYEGRNYFNFRAVDVAGNVSTNYRVNVSSDNTPPPAPSVIESHCGLPEEWTAHTSPNFTWMSVFDAGEFEGNGSGINRYEVSVNNGAWNPVNSGWEPTYGTGQYTFRFRSVDNVGLASGVDTKIVYIDDTSPNPPLVTEQHCGGSTSENPPWTTHTTPYFTWSDPGDVGSGVGGYKVSVNEGEWSAVSSGWEPEYGNGSYTFDFQSIDRVGHTSTSYRLYVRIHEPVKIYVKQNATGSNNGSSWTDAFTDLQSALSAAVANDTIWVAAGTYKPSVDKTGNSTPADARTKTFQLESDVPVFGGFAGTETKLTDRGDPGSNVTVLCGDIGTQDDNADNCYSVVRGVNNSTLDGFTVTRGNGNGTVSLETDLGGGIGNNAVSNVKTRNCIFRNNYSKMGGAAGNYFCTDSIIFSNCIFLANTSDNGGAIGNWDIRAYVTNCVFAGNNASSATGWGSAIFNWGSGSTSQIINSTFFNNTSSTSGGVISNRGVTSTVTNCILWGNSANDIYSTNGGASILTYSCIEQSGYAGSNGNISSDPQFLDAANGDFHLTPSSPCIDAGNGDAAPNTDLDRNLRFDHPVVTNTGTGDPVYSDIGVYECLLTTNDDNPATETLIIYPNPNKGIFTITGVDLDQIEVFDVTGRLIYHSIDNLTHEINLGQQSKGMYFVKMKIGNKQIVKEIIIY